MERERLISVAAALEFSWGELCRAGLECKDAVYLVRRTADELKQIAEWSEEDQMRIRATAMHLAQIAPLWAS